MDEPPAAAMTPEMEASAPGAACDGPAAAMDGFAQQLLERVTEKKVSLGTFLGQASALAAEGDALVITVSERQAFLQDALQTPENVALLQAEAAAVAGRALRMRIRIETPVSDDLAAIAGQEAPGSEPSRRDRLIEDALKEPVVRTVMDMFKGRIVDIREAR
jgi:hypothetical protein